MVIIKLYGFEYLFDVNCVTYAIKFKRYERTKFQKVYFPFHFIFE
jgi:hypothetical protein